MNMCFLRGNVHATVALLALLGVTNMLVGQQPGPPDAAVATPTDATLATDAGGAGDEPLSSVEQGQTPLGEIFERDRRLWRMEKRRDAIRDTQFRINLRSYYFDRDKFDGSKSESLAIGGWAGFKTGYFLDHISFGATVYTSQHLYGDDRNDGALLLEPGQDGYTVLGEAYADIRIIDGLNLYVGRKEFDTPFINRNDTRMTPNTFEAIVLQGLAKLGEEGATLKYGVGYFDSIKERNSDEFVSMSSDAGAEVDRGVFTAGAVYKKGDFSIGAIDYYSPDVINIGYAEAKVAFPINDDLKPVLALQYTDQRSVGDGLLQDDDFSVRQYGVKAELPVGRALFTAAYTHNTDGGTIQSPWSLYPGYTAVQVEEFLRAGEAALLLRAAYDLRWVEGLSVYTLWAHGMDPEDEGQFARDEVDFNIQWAPPKGILKGFSVRVRYAIVEQHGGDADYLNDFRVICNYGVNF